MQCPAHTHTTARPRQARVRRLNLRALPASESSRCAQPARQRLETGERCPALFPPWPHMLLACACCWRVTLASAHNTRARMTSAAAGAWIGCAYTHATAPVHI